MSDDGRTVDVAQTMSKAAERPRARDAAAMTREAGTREATKADERPIAMFADGEAAGYRTRWDAIQTGFVDEPRRAVQEADALVDTMIKRLSEVFANERTTLEQQWGRGDEISTEDLRVALRKYRSFFERLLSM
jgi:hypothetical protein